jgi:hypothetical protein
MNTSIASDPTAVNSSLPEPTIKKVVQWLTVRYPEGAIASYPMYPADEGIALLRIEENLRPEDKVIAVTPCLDQFFLVETGGQLDMGTTPQEARFWAQESLLALKRAAETKRGRDRAETNTL